MPGKNFAQPRPVNLSDKREKGCGNGAIPSGWFPHCQHQPEKTTIVTCLGIYCNSRTDRRIILSFSFYQFVLKCSPGFWKSSRNLPPILKARDVANGAKHMEGEYINTWMEKRSKLCEKGGWMLVLEGKVPDQVFWSARYVPPAHSSYCARFYGEVLLHTVWHTLLHRSRTQSTNHL